MNEITDAKERSGAAQRVTLIGALINLLLSVIKIIIGYTASSQALIADGIHSLSDLFSDAVVWLAARQSINRPDRDHPYGHGRYETLATLFLGTLLLLVAIGIGWDAAERLFNPDELLIPGVLAIYAALASILAKEALYHYTLHVARQSRSKLLVANAWHHRSDAISSIVVLIGVAGVMAGLEYLDAIAAIAVALMIAKMGLELGWEAMQELADRALAKTRVEEIRHWIGQVGGVRDVHMLRTRSLGGDASVDVHVLVEPRISVSEGHLISVLVETGLKQHFDEIMDVTVHIDPEDDEDPPDGPILPQRSQVVADLRQRCADLLPDLNSLDLVLHYLNGQVHLELQLNDAAVAEQDLAARLGDLGYLGSIKLLRTIQVQDPNKAHPNGA
ncbi:cation transporter [Magnetovirga frankeli]|uniref:cation diffusion facilitator family transporter n=1 Tax=Magnetovirga frankeli TaxID=947516 RepID=UPI0012930696|nr:cation transporter [gamma proteobacterium SS-5]